MEYRRGGWEEEGARVCAENEELGQNPRGGSKMNILIIRMLKVREMELAIEKQPL